jgi:hypothetical protein
MAKSPGGHGFPPSTKPPDPRLSIDEWGRVKKMFEDSSLAKYIIMAGVSGVVLMVIELVRVGFAIAKHFK